MTGMDSIGGSTLDLEQARTNMLVNQIRAWAVLDPALLELLRSVPREDFVPPAYRQLAFADMLLPIGHGQHMLPPKLEARMLLALGVRSTDVVLEIGTGSGYVTALLARSAAYVTSVDLYPEFADQAATRLAAQGIRNVRLETGDAATGWPDHGPYDGILVTGSVPELPREMTALLRPGGRLVAVVGRAPLMHAVRVTRTGVQDWRTETLFETEVPPLEHVSTAPAFVF